MPTLTREYLRSILDYDPETGVFRWKWRKNATPTNNSRDAGREAGCLRPTGYRYISIGYRHWAAHRLAFIWMTGSEPDGDVDHINLEKSDNRWINLRPATRSQNRGNITEYRNNSSGYKGVCFHKRTGKWQAYINIGGKRTYLGYFTSKEAAARAYAEAASRLYGEFARAS